MTYRWFYRGVQGLYKSGINFRSLIGMLCGPVDLFSSVLMMVSTSSLEMCAIKKLT